MSDKRDKPGVTADAIHLGGIGARQIDGGKLSHLISSDPMRIGFRSVPMPSTEHSAMSPGFI